MPITDVLILSLIIFAFVAFAAVLAWGDHQTRDIAKAGAGARRHGRSGAGAQAYY